MLDAQPGTSLKAWIEAHPEALGDRVRARFGVDLPYLFKARAARAAGGGWALGLAAHPGGRRLAAARQPPTPAPVAAAPRGAQVLSVQTALSIQSHPDKKLAEKLHAARPQVRAGWRRSA